MICLLSKTRLGQLASADFSLCQKKTESTHCLCDWFIVNVTPEKDLAEN